MGILIGLKLNGLKKYFFLFKLKKYIIIIMFTRVQNFHYSHKIITTYQHKKNIKSYFSCKKGLIW